jgi:predicted O-methyltransferase YrrM
MGHEFMSPLRRWEILAGLAQEIEAKTFVEVGCREGRTTGFMLSVLPEIKVIAIDPWSPVPNEAEDYKDWDFSAIEAEFWKNVGEHRDRCIMLRQTSFDANITFGLDPEDLLSKVKFMPIDMVFIDAGHDYQSCKQDIELWWPRVREGGYLCGHDYQHKFPGVMRAVSDAFPLLDVAVFPDSVWCVEKRTGLKRAA